MRGNTRSSTKTLMETKKKKHVLLIDEALDWLQIWMAASLLDVKGNKGIKKKFVFLANLPSMVTYVILKLILCTLKVLNHNPVYLP